MLVFFLFFVTVADKALNFKVTYIEPGIILELINPYTHEPRIHHDYTCSFLCMYLPSK